MTRLWRAALKAQSKADAQGEDSTLGVLLFRFFLKHYNA